MRGAEFPQTVRNQDMLYGDQPGPQIGADCYRQRDGKQPLGQVRHDASRALVVLSEVQTVKKQRKQKGSNFRKAPSCDHRKAGIPDSAGGKAGKPDGGQQNFDKLFKNLGGSALCHAPDGGKVSVHGGGDCDKGHTDPEEAERGDGARIGKPFAADIVCGQLEKQAGQKSHGCTVNKTPAHHGADFAVGFFSDCLCGHACGGEIDSGGCECDRERIDGHDQCEQPHARRSDPVGYIGVERNADRSHQKRCGSQKCRICKKT